MKISNTFFASEIKYTIVEIFLLISWQKYIKSGNPDVKKARTFLRFWLMKLKKYWLILLLPNHNFQLTSFISIKAFSFRLHLQIQHFEMPLVLLDWFLFEQALRWWCHFVWFCRHLCFHSSRRCWAAAGRKCGKTGEVVLIMSTGPQLKQGIIVTFNVNCNIWNCMYFILLSLIYVHPLVTPSNYSVSFANIFIVFFFLHDKILRKKKNLT